MHSFVFSLFFKYLSKTLNLETEPFLMRTVEEIQNVVFSAFENMLIHPAMYMPCATEEFEARLSTYLWVLAISDNAEVAWSSELELMRERKGWPEPLDVLASIKSELASKEVTNKESLEERLIEQVVEFYKEMAERLGFVSDCNGED